MKKAIPAIIEKAIPMMLLLFLSSLYLAKFRHIAAIEAIKHNVDMPKRMT